VVAQISSPGAPLRNAQALPRQVQHRGGHAGGSAQRAPRTLRDGTESRGPCV
jgi:hypothetical protein